MVRPIASQMRRNYVRGMGDAQRGEKSYETLSEDAFDPSLTCGSKKPNRRPRPGSGPARMLAPRLLPTRRSRRNVAGALVASDLH